MRLTVEEAAAGSRLDRYLADHLERTSRAVIMKYLKEGRARLNGRRARPGERIQAGDTIELFDLEKSLRRIRKGRAEGQPEVARIDSLPRDVAVLYEDEYLVAVQKPAGLVMHPGEGHEDEGLDRILAGHFGPSTRLVHRLDRETSGIVVAARGHPRSARRLAEAFRTGDVEKSYLALVRGVPEPPAGEIVAALLDRREPGQEVRVDAEGKASRTDYEVVEEWGRFAWLRVEPRTGRRHQIRVHLAHIGHPLAVDRQYGRRRRLRLLELRPDLGPSWKNPVILNRTPLHAEEITLRHPKTGEDLTLAAPLPEDLQRVLDLLREGPPAPSEGS